MKGFMKKALAGTLSLAMVFGMASVVSPETASAKKVKVKKVTVSAPSGKTAYVAKGKKVKLTATVKVTPNKSANKKVTYKSANKKIATVNSKGYIKGVKAGKTKITVVSKKNKKKKATIKVVVKKAAVKKVTLSASKATLAVGAKKTLKATVTPKKNTSNKVVWSTSKKKVATVTSKGVVKGVAEGTATITAKAADGSGKKATCKVTVGAGISDVTVPASRIVRVSLTSARALTAADFTVQQKSTPSGQYNTTEGVEKVVSNDGGKTYDVVLDNESGIVSYSYVKVTIPALAVDRSKEVFISDIAGYGYGVNDTITRVKGVVGDTYDERWYLDDVDYIGAVKYSVTGLPEGLKAVVNKNGTSVSVKGKYAKVENGTTAVLTGVDETGKTFKRGYVFYVGDKNTIVGNALDDTLLAYVPRDPNVKDSVATGYDFDENIKDLANLVVAGGSGDYEYAVTGLPATVDSMSVEGEIDPIYNAEGRRQAVPAGTYNVSLTVKDSENPNIAAVIPFKLNVVDGVVLSGTVKDASGAPAKDINVRGYTKMDAYGRYCVFSATTKADGTYKVRILPGDYYEYARFDNNYDLSIGNVYTAGSAVKDFTLPVYKVKFATVAGATAYSDYYYSYPRVYDAYGSAANLYVDDDDYSLYSYLKAGTYEFSSAADNDDNVVRAYSKYETIAESGETYLSSDNLIGDVKLSGSFNVAGNGTVQLTAAPYVESAQ